MPTRPATPIAPATMAPVEIPCFFGAGNGYVPPPPGCTTTDVEPPGPPGPPPPPGPPGPGIGAESGPGGGPSGPGTGVGPGIGVGAGAGAAPPRLLCPGGSHHEGRGLHALGAKEPSCLRAAVAVPLPYLPSGCIPSAL